MADKEIPKTYDFGPTEERVYRKWLDAGVLRSMPDQRSGRFVIMMPLPNVTGALHMGHAMDNVMQDLLTRWHRMKGDNVLWQPGTDHAGIATQAVVEKRLLELEGKTRHDLGREALVRRIWEWKDQNEARIVSQQQRMGCSCDWGRSRFTMDEVCTAAVRECFFRLFKDGLVYRGVRLVNWDCLLQTAVSDDEIITEVVQGHFWHLRYPVKDPKPGEPAHVVVATTRPETMLGDTAVACHPDPRGCLESLIRETEEKTAKASALDRPAIEAELEGLRARLRTLAPHLEKLRDMAKDGRQVVLPLAERPIPLVLDEWAKPEMGSGCVKITPGHDPNDYAVWERQKGLIGIVSILRPDGTLNENAGRYAGMDVKGAREAVLSDLESRSLIEAVEDREIPIGHSDRSRTPIEPFLSKQWFVRMGDREGGVEMAAGTTRSFKAGGLAQAAIDAVVGPWKSGSGLKLEFHPDHERYSGIYLAWLKEKRDWCISRQLWWGHRIPIWTASLDAVQMGRFLESVRSVPAEDLYFRVFDAEGKAVDVSKEGHAGEGGPLEVQLCLRSSEAERRCSDLLRPLGFVQDPDVLDTWFSSALWPFSTLGWPDPRAASVNPGQTSLAAVEGVQSSLGYYYPGTCLVTGRDIITLWVARMIMMGLYCVGDLPFSHCFIHANILDGKGERMSKSRGNGIDPVDIIERYGADAMRYILCEMQTGTQDIRLPVQAVSPFTEKLLDLSKLKHGPSIFTYICPDSGKEFDVLGTLSGLPRATLVSDRFEVGRAFCTKLWNASRFAFMNLGEHPFSPLEGADLRDEDRWILSRLARAIETVTESLRQYGPSVAIGAAREFFWSDLCDWYIELVRPRLKDESSAVEGGARAARTVLSFALDRTLRILHPMVPFITESLWERLNSQAPVRGLEEALPKADFLVNAAWPEPLERFKDPAIEAEFERLRAVIRAIRDLRSKHLVPAKDRLKASIRVRGEALTSLKRLERHIVSQAGLCELRMDAEVSSPPASAAAVAAWAAGPGAEVFVEGIRDLGQGPRGQGPRGQGPRSQECERLGKQIAQLRVKIEASEKRLADPKFTDRAPASIVETERQRRALAKGQLAALEGQLKSLG
ncbi:MAG: valine--tRNA ligase [Elusimicrobia bacterium]|nr:valine--tRNA ligase [Elusimicrobiota bacterium]